MGDIVRKEPGRMIEWDPFRAMREMLRWDPFREMAPIAPAFERLSFNPTFDVTETKDAYLFKADLPGVKPEDLEISVTGNRLQISGKRELEQEQKDEAVYAYERQYGSFVRGFTLPPSADLGHAKSELKDGVLTLAIPKLAEATTRKIAVTSGEVKKS